jgi:hypothetical protein
MPYKQMEKQVIKGNHEWNGNRGEIHEEVQ